jgi:hypothetical protein
MLASGDVEQIKAAQRELQGLGYYRGKIDGVIGEGEKSLTREAAENFRKDAESQAARDAERAGAETRTRGLEAEAEAAKAKLRSTEVENDPANRLTKMGTEVAPYVAGVGVGTAAGHFFGKRFAAQDKAAGQGVGRLANERGLDPNAREAQLNRLNRERGRRNISQFGAPAALGAMGYATRNIIAPAFSDPQTQDIIKSVGTGENAAAATLGVHQLVSTLGRGNPNDPVDEARIRSRPPAPPPNAPPQAPVLRTPSDRLTSAARAAGAQGKLTKAAAAKYLEANVTPENRAAVATELGVGPGQKITSAVKKLATSRKPSMIAGPMIAAGLGYDAASSDAEAAGATPAEARTQGAAAGTGAAAATGGALYGLSKLPKALTRAAGVGSGLLAPYAAADAYDPSPEELNRDRNVAARNLPSMLRGGAIEDAYQMAQVPEASPTRSVLSDYTAKRAGPLSSASALQVPEGIPLPREDGVSPYEAAQPARAASGDQRFDDALSSFLALIQEHNSSVSQGAQR